LNGRINVIALDPRSCVGRPYIGVLGSQWSWSPNVEPGATVEEFWKGIRG